MEAPMTRLEKIAIAFDQLIGAVFVGTYPDETISAYCHRTGSVWEPFIDALFFWQKDHCFESYLSEKERKQMPQEYRDA